MKSSPENITELEKSCQLSDRPNINKFGIFSPENANLTEPLIEIKNILNEAYLKVNKYYTELQQKCISLEAAFQSLKKTKQCSQCYKAEAEDAIVNKTVFGEGIPSSPRTLQFNKSDDISDCIASLTPIRLQETNEDQNSLIKTPPSKKLNYHTSPVVQKQTRSGKRRKIRLSSNSQRTDHEIDRSPICSAASSELTFMNRSLHTRSENEVHYDITPLAEESDDSLIAPSPVQQSRHQHRVNSIFGDKKLSDVDAYMNNDNVVLSPVSASPPKVNKNDINGNVKKQKTKWDLKKSRGSSGDKLKQTLLSTTFFAKPVDITESSKFKGGVASEENISKLTESEDMELTNINNSSTNRSCDRDNNMNDLSSRFEETIFYDDPPQKNTAHKPTVLNELNIPREAIFYTDHLKRTKETKSATGQLDTAVHQKTNEKENKLFIEFDTAQEETFFNPLVTSTHQEVEIKEQSPKITAPPLVKNSFDYIPSPEKEPKYKYRRDAVRKKADRQKLDGWECAMCYNFYAEHRKQFGDTQVNLIRKCSRHRDRFPINANTPPGLWNPKFDDTDDES